MDDNSSTDSYDMKSKVDDDATLTCFLRAMMYTVQQEHVRKVVKLRWNIMGAQGKSIHFHDISLCDYIEYIII